MQHYETDQDQSVAQEILALLKKLTRRLPALVLPATLSMNSRATLVDLDAIGRAYARERADLRSPNPTYFEKDMIDTMRHAAAHFDANLKDGNAYDRVTMYDSEIDRYEPVIQRARVKQPDGSFKEFTKIQLRRGDNMISMQHNRETGEYNAVIRRVAGKDRELVGKEIRFSNLPEAAKLAHNYRVYSAADRS